MGDDWVPRCCWDLRTETTKVGSYHWEHLKATDWVPRCLLALKREPKRGESFH